MLLDRVARSFAAEAAEADDVAWRSSAARPAKGLRLLQLLDRQYAVVATNPPYMGSKNMEEELRRYVELGFKSGKRDLYTAFILRCLDLTQTCGRTAMITMQGWMFAGSFADLRAIDSDRVQTPQRGGRFAGVLRETTVEAVAQLGRYAFSEIGNAVVAPVLFALAKQAPGTAHRIWACRLSAPKPAEEQAILLQSLVRGIDFENSNDVRCPLPSSISVLRSSWTSTHDWHG